MVSSSSSSPSLPSLSLSFFFFFFSRTAFLNFFSCPFVCPLLWNERLVRAKVLFDLGEYEKALESISDDVNGTKHLRKGAPRHLIDEARSLRDCITQIMASGANEHQRGNEAFQCEEFHRAAKHYRRAIQGQCDRQVLGTLHSNLSACYFKSKSLVFVVFWQLFFSSPTF